MQRRDPTRRTPIPPGSPGSPRPSQAGRSAQPPGVAARRRGGGRPPSPRLPPTWSSSLLRPAALSAPKSNPPGPAPPLASRASPAAGRPAASVMVRAEATLAGPAPPQSLGHRAPRHCGAPTGFGGLAPLQGPPGGRGRIPEAGARAAPEPATPTPLGLPALSPEHTREAFTDVTRVSHKLSDQSEHESPQNQSPRLPGFGRQSCSPLGSTGKGVSEAGRRLGC